MPIDNTASLHLLYIRIVKRITATTGTGGTGSDPGNFLIKRLFLPNHGEFWTLIADFGRIFGN